MPIISFSERDLLRGKIVTPGWYRVRIEEVTEKPSKAGDSTNYPIAGTIIKNADNGDEEFAGVPIDWMFNSKAINFSQGFLISLGVELKANTRIELKAAEGHDVEMFIENETYEGRLKNAVNHKYRPVRTT